MIYFQATEFIWEGARIRHGRTHLQIKNFNTNDANFHQTGTKTICTQSLIEILGTMAKAPAFDILHHKKQLSYDVSFDVHDDGGILGYSITVKPQETKFTSDYVDGQILTFLYDLINAVLQISEDDFDTLKRSLARNKWIEYDKRIEDNEWIWYRDRDEFNRVHEEVEYLLNITRSQFVHFYMAALSQGGERK